LAINGTLKGNVSDFDLTGHAIGSRVIARGNFARDLRADFTWTNARTQSSSISASASADSTSIMGFAFDTVTAKLTYAKPGGHVELAVTQADKRHYAASGEYDFYPDRKQLQLASMSFQFDTSSWTMPQKSTIEWGGPGVRVTNFELRNKGNARIYANGLLPTSGVADFRLDVDSFPVTDVFDLLQSDLQLKGVATLHGSMKGTLTDPSFNGTFGFTGGEYNSIPVPNLNGRFAYANEQLTSHVDAVRANGQSMAVADAQLPINLALKGATGDRLLPKPMSVSVVADSLPLDLLPQFTDIVSNVKGRAAGRLSMTGTLRRPTLSGTVTLDHGAAKITSSGATISNIVAAVHMANDTVFLDSIAGTARGPVRVRGSLAVGSWRDPRMNLFLTSSGAQLMNNEWANVRVDAGLALTGPFNRAYLSGAVTVTQGVVYAPEPTGRHLIGAGDPALFNVLDTTRTDEANLFPTPSPLLANLRVDVNVAVRRDTWVRNREANVEIYTDDPLFVHVEQEAMSLTGVLNTDRGEYAFMSKRFQVQRGSAMFVGSPDLNPTLQITGDYQVQSHGLVTIRVEVGGTLKRPSLSLESDAQPPMTQSELLSLLAFGQSTTSLAFNSSSIAGSAATSDLFGVGAQLAARQLASVALGVAVEQVQLQAGKSLGTDVFDITPADVPFGGFGQQNGFSGFIEDTKVEAGKYLNPRTYVSAQEQARRLGASIEYRRGDGWRFNATIEPRIFLLEPTLNSQPLATRQAYGGFVIREWRF
jgi:translocation and assembly module TamB